MAGSNVRAGPLVSVPIACIDCGKPGKGTRCEHHARLHAQRRGKTGWDRQKANALILAANPWCQICKLERSTVVDHIKPLWQGGTNDARNLQALGQGCHRKKTAQEARMRQGKRR